MSGQRTVSWGILGCGTIAGKFASSIAALDDTPLIAVASRTPDKARKFAEKWHVPVYYDNYEELVASKDVDAIYVATTHNFHHDNISLALEHGKHVLCEKPFTVNAREAAQLIKLARSRKLFLMEGMWTRFLPAMVQLRQWLAEGVIGDIRQVRADFGFRNDLDPANRLFNLELAGGALLDAGIYPLSFASMVMREKPQQIRALAAIGTSGVDEQSAYLLGYSTGRLALLSSAARTELDNRAEVIGTTGRIFIPSRFLVTKRLELHRPNQPVVAMDFPFETTEGFKFEIAAASDAIRAGKTEDPTMPLDETLMIMETIDTIKQQLGLVYSNDRLRRYCGNNPGPQLLEPTPH
jgi:predicted dehydrogenase